MTGLICNSKKSHQLHRGETSLEQDKSGGRQVNQEATVKRQQAWAQTREMVAEMHSGISLLKPLALILHLRHQY